MNTNLVCEFNVDKTNNTIHIKREFKGPLALVWKAWTTSELLDQWWGPQPWRAETKSMDFSERGHWLYAMVSPEGEKHWSKADYISISPEQSFSQRDGFCDENGVLNPAFPQNHVENSFVEVGAGDSGGEGRASGSVVSGEVGMDASAVRTEVNMKLTFDKLADLEQTINMDFKEGILQDFDQLDEFLVKWQG